MTTVRNLSVVLLLTLFSCQHKKHNDYDKLIVGEWNFSRIQWPETKSDELVEPPQLSDGGSHHGYIFSTKDTCVSKLGFFNNRFDNSIFLGTRTKYKIENDSLKIFSLSDSTWNTLKIHSINSDTLTLYSSDSVFFIFAKSNYKLDTTTLFDQLIITTSPCYGSCPITSTIISNEGEVFYYGEEYNTVNGYYRGEIKKEKFDEIETEFKKANILKLKEHYVANHSDDQEVSITFIKNDQIIKTIKDYGRVAPDELYWAYYALPYLYQQTKLDTISNIPEYFDCGLLSYEIENKEWVLMYSEGFYLKYLLYNAKPTLKKFTAKYTLNSNDEKIGKIKTDGQYYQFLLKNRKSFTLDIGFNFIEANRKQIKFRNNNEID